MTTKKPFIFTREVSFVVLADDERDAHRMGRRYMEDAVGDDYDTLGHVTPLTSLKQLPPGWDEETLTYHDKQNVKDISVADVLNDVGLSPDAEPPPSEG